jgi:Flp pilus assembly protein TadG
VERRRGQALVESALVLLVLIAVLIGIFDLGQVLFVRQTFTARARGAARHGAVTDAAEADIKNMVLYGQTTAPEGSTSGAFGLTAGMISVAKPDLGTSEQRVVVTISGYPYRMFSPWIGGSFTGRPVIASVPLETP